MILVANDVWVKHVSRLTLEYHITEKKKSTHPKLGPLNQYTLLPCQYLPIVPLVFMYAH